MPRVLEPNRTYSFPFTFVVPDRLLPQVCTHDADNAQVHTSHTVLPPTLGDPMLAGNGKTLLNDMAPDMAQIAYVVRASVLARSQTDSGRLKALANVGKKVRIIPYVEEVPPLQGLKKPYYWSSKEKNVHRGFLRGKLGRLTATSAQPAPIRLLPPNCEPNDTVSTVANVQLRFDPIKNEQPPRLGSMASKLRASTFYSASAWRDLPTQNGFEPFTQAGQGQAGQGVFVETVPLSTMCVASAKWEKHTDTDTIRRDSMNSMISEDSIESSATYYTASLVIPVTLPTTKAFVPTFHTCLISRVYALDLSLSWHTPAANVLTPNISLRLPIQIITQPKFDLAKEPSEVVVTEAELNEFFQPRSIAPSVTEAVVDVTPPPGYSETVVQPLPASS